MEKLENLYADASIKIIDAIGGKNNIESATHCATRLRIVFVSKDIINMEKIEDVEGVKGVFIVGDQLQIIFGAGKVNDVYAVFSKKLSGDIQNTSEENLSNKEISDKKATKKKQNPIQSAIKSLSDVFVSIIPGLLAAALLMGITGLLSQQGVFAEKSVIEMYPALAGINRFMQITSTGIFTVLPLLVVYSATKRYGGNPVLGIIIGAIMLHPDLANAYGVGNGTASAEVINIFGLNVQLVGFQGGIIVALMMGFIVAKLDIFFIKRIPDMIKLFLAPFLTVIISSFLLFTVIGPVGRGLSDGVTSALLWCTVNLGVIGYMIFAGVQQVIVITGLHHVIGAVEAQLIANTGRDFIMPLMSVALIGQGGAVLGFLYLNWKNNKAKQIGISSFGSILFGISEPAIFGITLKYKFPLIAGCIAASIGGAYVYFTKVTSIGFGATAIPGLAIVAPENNGHMNYIIAHLITLVIGMVLTIILGKMNKKRTA